MLTLNGIQTTENLRTTEGIQAYLIQTPFVASSVERLSGGAANYTFRANLVSPDQSGRQSIIVKYATGFAAASESMASEAIPLSVERTVSRLVPIVSVDLNTAILIPYIIQDIEVAAIDVVARQPFISELKGQKVLLPELLAYDQENRIQICRDYGPLPSIKEYIRAHPEAKDIGKEAGEVLGEFLAHLHIWGYRLLHPGSAKDGKGDSSEIDVFRNNVIGKRLCAWRASGRLADVAKAYKVPGDWTEISKKSIEDITENNDTFNMGDFWYAEILRCGV
jgi:hypothetical protein